MRSNKVYAVVAAAVAALLIACGSGDPTSSPADGSAAGSGKDNQGPTTVDSGAAVNITTGSGDQLTVTISEPKAPVSSGNQFMAPEKGHFFTVTATVEFKSGDDTYFANATDFKLVTSDGTVYEAEIVTTIEPDFGATTLNPGQKLTGKVVFDVPTTVKPGGAKIQFTGSWDGKAAAYWNV